MFSVIRSGIGVFLDGTGSSVIEGVFGRLRSLRPSSGLIPFFSSGLPEDFPGLSFFRSLGFLFVSSSLGGDTGGLYSLETFKYSGQLLEGSFYLYISSYNKRYSIFKSTENEY